MQRRCAKRLYDWGEIDVPVVDRFSLFEALGCDLEIIKNVLLLTGALHGTATQVSGDLNASNTSEEFQYRYFPGQEMLESNGPLESWLMISLSSEDPFVSLRHSRKCSCDTEQSFPVVVYEGEMILHPGHSC